MKNIKNIRLGKTYYIIDSIREGYFRNNNPIPDLKDMVIPVMLSSFKYDICEDAKHRYLELSTFVEMVSLDGARKYPIIHIDDIFNSKKEAFERLRWKWRGESISLSKFADELNNLIDGFERTKHG